MTSSKLKKNDQHTHDMTQIEGGHIDDRVGAVPGPDNVNRRVSGPGTEPGSVPGLARLKWAICKRGLCLIPLWLQVTEGNPVTNRSQSTMARAIGGHCTG